MSFYFASTIFSKNIFKNYIIFTALYVLVLSITFEVLQLLNIVKGTFDYIDIITYIIAIITASLIEKKLEEKYEKI